MILMCVKMSMMVCACIVPRLSDADFPCQPRSLPCRSLDSLWSEAKDTKWSLNNSSLICFVSDPQVAVLFKQPAFSMTDSSKPTVLHYGTSRISFELHLVWQINSSCNFKNSVHIYQHFYLLTVCDGRGCHKPWCIFLLNQSIFGEKYFPVWWCIVACWTFPTFEGFWCGLSLLASHRGRTQ